MYESSDPTENARRAMVKEINLNPSQREVLEEKHGEVWDTTELQEHYIVNGFMAPFVSVTRKSDKQEGLLQFQHHPRYYYGFSF